MSTCNTLFRHFAQYGAYLCLALQLSALPLSAQTNTIALGHGNATSPYFPLNSCYSYTYSQQIYTAAEISNASGLPGDITAIRFFHVAGADAIGTGWNNWTVYLGGTLQNAFGSAADWVPYPQLQQVFSGSVQPVLGNWMEIVLDTPFHWDGTMNLVVAVHENSPGFGCTAIWKAYDAPAPRALLFQSDFIDPNPAMPPAASMPPSARMAQVQFIGTTAACMPPYNLAATNVASASLLLSWTDIGATAYTYEVRASGVPGSGNTGLFATGDVTSGNPAIDIQGLTPNTDFFVYLRSNCNGNFSLWSYPLLVHTPCETTALPYSETFNEAVPPALPPCMATAQATGPQWATSVAGIPGMAGACAHVAYDLISLPDQWLFTTGLALQGGVAYRLTYQYGNGSTDHSDNLSVQLCSGPYAAALTTGLAQHTEISSANAIDNQVDFTPPTSGTWYIGFRYYATPGGNPGQMFLDQIQVVTAPTCEPVLNVSATATGTNAGTVTWTPPTLAPAAGYDLYYSTTPNAPSVATVPNFSGIVGTNQQISSLGQGIPVYAWVRSNCSTSNQSDWTGPTVFTPGIYQIGNGNAQSASYPISSCHAYTYSQQIYLASEYNGGPYITHLRFKYLGGSGNPSAWTQWNVYMANTPLSAFAGQTSWVPFAQLQEVFSGIVAPSAGDWMDLTLTTPFLWNGIDNLVVAVDENAPGASCTASWAAFPTTTARGLIYYADFMNPDPATPPAASQGADFSIAQVQFITGIQTACNTLPSPGTTTGPTSICPGVSFTVSVENTSTEGGITNQWQTSANGTSWDNAAGASTGLQYQAQQAVDTWYRCQVTCATTGTTTSAPLLVATNPFTNCYCENIDFTMQVEPICNVTFAGINHNSVGTVDGAPAWENFTAVPAAEVIAGQNFPISVTGNTNGNFTDRISVFFDWDRDGVFETALNLPSITNTDCTNPATALVLVPQAAQAGTTRMRVVKNALTYPTDPCGSYSFGQAEDYLVNITVPLPCDALPTPGATTGPGSACAGTTFTLGLQNPSSQPGISYQWQYSVDGLAWADAPGTSNLSSYSPTQNAPTWYRAAVTCASAGTATSDPLLVAIKAPSECYCTTLAFSYQVQPICHVAFAGIDNTSNNTPGNLAPLEDFTASTPGQVTAGFAYPIAVTGFSDATTSQVAVFFDWNQDGVFETSVPLGSITNQACTTPLTGTVHVPLNAAPGLSRMRVVLGDFQVPTDPCATYISGQGEDYLINVLVPEACAATPAPGATTGPASTCPSVPFTLGITNVQLQTGITYQWQTSMDGAAWTNAPGNSDEANFTTSIGAPTWFRAKTTCDAAGSSFSDPLHVLLAPPVDCYCGTINFSAAVLPICHVSFAGMAHASTGTLNSSPALEDFSSSTASVMQGQTYTLQVAGNAAGATGFVSAFFDWDGNGVFETAVQVGIITGSPCVDTAMIAITVPPAATPGLFHMRIVMNASNYATDPCAQYAQGQAEDYSIMVNDAIGIAEASAPVGIRVFPNPAHTEIYLQTPGNKPEDIIIYDLTGKLVMQQQQVRRIDVSPLVPGCYLLTVRQATGGAAVHVRFVKE